MTNVIQLLVIPRKMLMWVALAVAIVVAIQYGAAIIVRSYHVEAADVACTVKSIDAVKSVLTAKLDCGKKQEVSVDSADLIAAHLRSPDKPLLCTFYGGWSRGRQCKVASD